MRLHAGPVGSTQQFFADHVVPRKPACFDCLPPDLEHLPGLWTDKHLINRAGDALLQVEQRRGEGEAFGKGDSTRVPLNLGTALSRMAAGDTSLYITTQPVPTASDGHPALYASPLAELAADLPLVPQIMGRLVPQSINIWLGAAPNGSSSGLHCDYHDNLYVLLRGRKRFRLYPPSQASNMYTVGKVQTVHANGRIVFKGQGDILPDGSEAGDAARWLARHDAEAELAAAEAAVAEGLPGAAKRLKLAERHLDAALEAALDDGDWDGCDDFDALMDSSAAAGAAGTAPPPAPAAAGDNESFSRVDLRLPDDQLRYRYPRFPGKEAALVCEVAAGQTLYLPAGWFHEVTSYSTADSPTHLALNFWYHPPDNLSQGARVAAAQPYRSAFWPAVWEGRRSEYEERHRQPAGHHGEVVKQQAAGTAQQDAQLAAALGEAVQQAAAATGREQLGGAPGAAATDNEDKGRLTRQGERIMAGSSRGHALVLPHSYGLFGVGRRQHLHRFVTLKRKRLWH